LNGTDQGAVNVTSGSFAKTITLAEGANTIVVTATDAANQKTTVTINVTLDTTARRLRQSRLSPTLWMLGQQ